MQSAQWLFELPAHESSGTCVIKMRKLADSGTQILFVINQPDVYKSPSSNTYMYVKEETPPRIASLTDLQHLR